MPAPHDCGSVVFGKMSAVFLILVLASGAALCVSLALFLISRPKRNGRLAATERKTRNVETARPTGPGSNATVQPRKLSEHERRDMLEGVKNLAESDPKKVAGLIRNWIHEDDA